MALRLFRGLHFWRKKSLWPTLNSAVWDTKSLATLQQVVIDQLFNFILCDKSTQYDHADQLNI